MREKKKMLSPKNSGYIWLVMNLVRDRGNEGEQERRYGKAFHLCRSSSKNNVPPVGREQWSTTTADSHSLQPGRCRLNRQADSQLSLCQRLTLSAGQRHTDLCQTHIHATGDSWSTGGNYLTRRMPVFLCCWEIRA